MRRFCYRFFGIHYQNAAFQCEQQVKFENYIRTNNTWVAQVRNEETWDGTHGLNVSKSRNLASWVWEQFANFDATLESVIGFDQRAGMRAREAISNEFLKDLHSIFPTVWSHPQKPTLAVISTSFSRDIQSQRAHASKSTLHAEYKRVSFNLRLFVNQKWLFLHFQGLCWLRVRISTHPRILSETLTFMHCAAPTRGKALQKPAGVC